ncbi:MAG: peptidoglycan DD-metalloendopeptidase family protein [Desulfotignum sp.]|nr:peptidoglycan DD-metalloendopeptidase family protein [Desulfotignum sp.]
MLSFLKTDFKITLVWSWLLFCLPAFLWADADIPVQQQKQTIETSITRQKDQISRFTQKEQQIIGDLNDIDYALNQARIKSGALAAEARNLEETMAVIQEDKKILAGRIRENQEHAGNRLCALYRMRMIGGLDMVGLPDTMFDFFVTQNALGQIVRSDFQILESQTRDLIRLQTLAAQLKEQKAAKARLEHDLARQVRIMEQEAQKKQAIRNEIRHKKTLSQAALASLEDAARALDEKIDAFVDQQAVLENTVFSSQKGRLPVPVKGTVVSGFGPKQSGDYKSFTFQSGIDIKVERGEPVRSVFKGEVIFAEWLKGYGNLVIIDHGENYYTLYAHLQEMFKKKGEAVNKGEVIATAGDTGSVKGLCLHFELRHHGRPVDPLKWLEKGA